MKGYRNMNYDDVFFLFYHLTLSLQSRGTIVQMCGFDGQHVLLTSVIGGLKPLLYCRIIDLSM